MGTSVCCRGGPKKTTKKKKKKKGKKYVPTQAKSTSFQAYKYHLVKTLFKITFRKAVKIKIVYDIDIEGS